MSRIGKYQYRSYHTTAVAWCSGHLPGCHTRGPQSSDKTRAAEEARAAGWYVGACFLCPTCRADSALMAAVKEAGKK